MSIFFRLGRLSSVNLYYIVMLCLNETVFSVIIGFPPGLTRLTRRVIRASNSSPTFTYIVRCETHSRFPPLEVPT
jgi:hypothetical protein